MKIKKSQLLDIVIYSIIIIYSVFLLIQFGTNNKDVFVFLTFLLIGTISFAGVALCKKNICAAKNLNIFSYVFFFLAPWQQYVNNTKLWSGNGLCLNFTDDLYLRTNIIIIIFLIIFNILYKYFEKKYNKSYLHSRYTHQDNILTITPKSNLIVMMISLCSLLLLLVTGSLTGTGVSIGGSAISSQIYNIVRFFPVCGIILYSIVYHSNYKKIWNNKYFIVNLIVFIVIYYPLWGNIARFLLFGAYIIVLSAFFSDSKYKSIYSALMIFGFCYLFSASRLATSLLSFKLSGFEVNFLHVDFDAYQMAMTMIQYVKDTGVTFGLNIISAFAFLIPRSIWPAKMENSGGIVSLYYGSWFTNTSAPLVGELYMALGLIGVIIGSLILGKILAKIDSYYSSNSLKEKGIFCIISGMMIYISRGSLLASMAFTLGIMLSLLLINHLAKIVKK